MISTEQFWQQKPRSKILLTPMIEQKSRRMARKELLRNWEWEPKLSVLILDPSSRQFCLWSPKGLMYCSPSTRVSFLGHRSQPLRTVMQWAFTTYKCSNHFPRTSLLTIRLLRSIRAESAPWNCSWKKENISLNDSNW